MKTSLLLVLSMAFVWGLKAQSFSMTQNDMYINITPNGDGYVSCYLNNLLPRRDTFNYERIVNTLDPGWDLFFCDPNTCVTTSVAADTFSVLANRQGLFKLEIFGNGIPGTGVLSYRIWDPEFPGSEDTITWYVNTAVVGTEELALAAELTVSPNPVHNQLTVFRAQGGLPKGQIAIFDLRGRLQMEQDVKGVGAATVDVADLPQGIYLLRYTAGNATVLRKFVKLD
jgi:Secretion system C-terminal sorting domain